VTERQAVSRREATRRTRGRLLDAALAILDEQGEKGLTTTAVTRRAGLAQSGFYVHFADMGALLRELVAEVWTERRHASAAARRAARADPDHGVADVVRESFRSTVTQSAAHPALLRLVLRSRLDPDSELGAMARAKADVSRARIAARLVPRRPLPDSADAGARADTSDADATDVGPATVARHARHARQADMVADGLAAVTEALVLGHLDGRYPDIDEILDVLVAFSSTGAVLGRAASPREAPPHPPPA
jgi:TetR/AcrR family transcriptional regulator, fatty acid biosynthesis regulator